MKPYYEHAGITIYHGDCREVTPLILGSVLITDPPYGVDLGAGDQRGGHHGLAKAAYDEYEDSFPNWQSLTLPRIREAILATTRGAVFAGKHVTLLPAPDAVGGVYCPSACGRNRWGFATFIPVYFYGVQPLLSVETRSIVLESTEVAEKNGHPCPKPYGWMTWLVQFSSRPFDAVYDPFMGSGTTLVAAKRLGRMAVGVDISERYCELAAQRLSQEVLPLELDTERDAVRVQQELP